MTVDGRTCSSQVGTADDWTSP